MERRAAQGGGVFGGVAGAGAAAAFAEDDVEHPVELIFHAPMAAYGARETGSVQTQTGEGVAAFEAAVPVEFAHGFHAANALKALPFVAVGKPADVGALPVAARFESAVALFHRLAVDEGGVASGDDGGEVALDFGQRGALVSFEG